MTFNRVKSNFPLSTGAEALVKSTLEFGLYVWAIQVFCWAAKLAASRSANYWLATAFATGGVGAAFLNFLYYIDAQHGAPALFFASLGFEAIVLVGYVMCALWPYNQKADSQANMSFPEPWPIPKTYLNRPDRNIASIDKLPFNLQSYRPRSHTQ